MNPVEASRLYAATFNARRSLYEETDGVVSMQDHRDAADEDLSKAEGALMDALHGTGWKGRTL